MMKAKTKIGILILMPCILLTACKKSDVEKSNWKQPMIKTSISNNVTTTFEYDKEGRIVKLDQGGFTIVDYSYRSDSVFVKQTETATNAVLYQSFKLNERGMGVAPGGGYKYDSEARVTEMYDPPKNNGWQRRYKYYYNTMTGLLDSIRQTESNLLQTRWLQTTIYKYDATQKNTIGFINMGAGFSGQTEPHPEIEYERWEPQSTLPHRNNTVSGKSVYGYDEQGRIVVKDYTEFRHVQNETVQWRTVYTYY